MSEVVFASPSATPGDLAGGDGSETNPFHSVQTAIEAVQGNGGGSVRLFGGHFVESVVLTDVAGEDSDSRIVVEPAEDTGEVFIDSCLPEFVEPNGRWVRLFPPDGAEFVWPDPFPGVVRHGAFYDRPRHTRLVSYDRVEDLRSDRQTWPRDEGENRVFVATDPEDENTTYKPQPLLSKPSRRQWVYMGPGIWFDESTDPDDRLVHIRLSETTNHIDGWPDYDGESDPNELSLALSRELERALFLKRCRHLEFRDLTLRFGSPETVLLNNCLDIVFDHCRIRSGSRAMFLGVDNDTQENRDIVVAHCEIDGGIPTWFFRSDRKDEYRFGPEDRDEVTKAETTENRLGASTSGVQLAGRARSFNVEVHHCEIVNAHDSYIFGDGMQFHHNWVNNLNDDGIAVSADADTKNAKIFCNVMTRTLTALSFASRRGVGVVHIYGNLFDLREPTLGIRPPTSDGVPDSLRQGHFFKDGANEGPIELFHNTCIVLDPGVKGDDFGDANDAGFSYYATIGDGLSARGAFNNIFVAAFTPGQVRPIAFLAPESFACETNGNTFFRIPEDDPKHNFLVRRRAGPAPLNEERVFADLTTYHQQYWPADPASEYEHDSLVQDPEFRSFDTATGEPHGSDDLRLRRRPPAEIPESPAWRAAVPMPDPLPDYIKAATGAKSRDRGCFHPKGGRLRVGVDSRMVFPPPPAGPPPPLPRPDTHDPVEDPPVLAPRD